MNIFDVVLNSGLNKYKTVSGVNAPETDIQKKLRELTSRPEIFPDTSELIKKLLRPEVFGQPKDFMPIQPFIRTAQPMNFGPLITPPSPDWMNRLIITRDESIPRDILGASWVLKNSTVPEERRYAKRTLASQGYDLVDGRLAKMSWNKDKKEWTPNFLEELLPGYSVKEIKSGNNWIIVGEGGKVKAQILKADEPGKENAIYIEWIESHTPGAGQRLMKALQKKYDHIYLDASSEEGASLAKKTGFKETIKPEEQVMGFGGGGWEWSNLKRR